MNAIPKKSTLNIVSGVYSEIKYLAEPMPTVVNKPTKSSSMWDLIMPRTQKYYEAWETEGRNGWS